MFRNSILAVVLLFCFCAKGMAQNQTASVVLSLFGAVQMAAQQNPKALMTKQRVQQSLEQLNQARSFLLPKVRGVSSWQRQTRNLESFGIPSSSATAPSVVGPFNVFDARLEITQTLFDLSMIRRLRVAGLGKDVSLLESKKIKQDVMALVGVLFVEATRGQDALKLSKTLLTSALKPLL